METKIVNKSTKFLNMISIILPVMMILLILNWLFSITPFQSLQGLPLVIAPLLSIILIVLGFFTFKNNRSIILKLGIGINLLIIIFSFLYHFLGTLIFGP